MPGLLRMWMFESFSALGDAASWAVPLVFSFLGGVFSILFQPILSIFNNRLALSARAWERIQDKRIDAFETLLDLAKFLSTTTSTGNHQDGWVETQPKFLSSMEDAKEGLDYVFRTCATLDDWIDQPTRQHLRYITDYFQNVSVTLAQIDEGKLLEFSLTIKPDIIDIATHTRMSAHKFYQSINKKCFSYHGNGKYPLRVTTRKLEKTKLIAWMIKHDLLAKNGMEMPQFNCDHAKPAQKQ